MTNSPLPEFEKGKLKKASETLREVRSEWLARPGITAVDIGCKGTLGWAVLPKEQTGKDIQALVNLVVIADNRPCEFTPPN